MFYDLPTESSDDDRPPRTRRIPPWWIAAAAAMLLLLAWLVFHGRGKPSPTAGVLPSAVPPGQTQDSATVTPEAPQGVVIGFPTAQKDLLNKTSLAVYQATASGRVESGWYGTVRMESVSGHVLPSFHEGLDIAALQRDRKGAPLDIVNAAADGRVAYVSRVAGNSNYGIYIVLLHDDPVGSFYTLYAHLARVEPWVKAGVPVQRGQPMALMGNTASNGIPMNRAHLHFEAGMVLNSRFQEWYRAQKQIPDHGNFHGHNLAGINPLSLFQNGSAETRFNMLKQLQAEPVAFTLLIKRTKPVDYFQRHPALWQGPPPSSQTVLTFSEGGVPLSGRAARPDETARAGKDAVTVLSADEAVLGRNGLRIVVRRDGVWKLGSQGERWLEILLY